MSISNMSDKKGTSVYPPQEKIHSSSELSVGDVLFKLSTKKWDPSPEWQRYYVWDHKKQNGLIDTLLRGWPIPPLWLREAYDDAGSECSEIIDGQQRVRTLQMFVEGKFDYTPVQTGLPSDIPEDVGSVSFSSMPAELKKRLQSANLTVIKCAIGPGSQVRQIFSRLNQSSMNLTAQELRNCSFQGPFKKMVYRLVDELQQDPFWSARVWKRAERDRMGGQARISELLVGLMKGAPQNRDEGVNEAYESYEQKWPDQEKVQARISQCLKAIKAICPGSNDGFTRNWSEFYTLFLLCDKWYQRGFHPHKGKQKEFLFETLRDFREGYQRHSEMRKILEKQDSRPDPGEAFERYYMTVNAENNKEYSRRERQHILEEVIGAGLEERRFDKARKFSPAQRDVVYMRKAKVQKNGTLLRDCDGNCGTNLPQDGRWECDHIVSHAQGGLTIVSNAQALCKSCHDKKSQGLL